MIEVEREGVVLRMDPETVRSVRGIAISLSGEYGADWHAAMAAAYPNADVAEIEIAIGLEYRTFTLAEFRDRLGFRGKP